MVHGRGARAGPAARSGSRARSAGLPRPHGRSGSRDPRRPVHQAALQGARRVTDPGRQAVAGAELGGRAMPAARIVLSIARLTLLETTRSRVVLVLAVLTLVSVGLTTWGI